MSTVVLQISHASKLQCEMSQQSLTCDWERSLTPSAWRRKQGPAAASCCRVCQPQHDAAPRGKKRPQSWSRCVNTYPESVYSALARIRLASDWDAFSLLMQLLAFPSRSTCYVAEKNPNQIMCSHLIKRTRAPSNWVFPPVHDWLVRAKRLARLRRFMVHGKLN